ncbi:unnamed protein product [Bursaphelenchus okinawaensis]|uniref:Uncharacterized protein n=1 Tax=Bursaphelenchus okinawaensis TaxID=465554 RepID=A0A811L6E4_9BILA|nr:unnamed protein product [Bursaphelenchus okinawaensis]CAG9116758.1 unnamed protein product [Bursaphelenchus okinawaensis]
MNSNEDLAKSFPFDIKKRTATEAEIHPIVPGALESLPKRFKQDGMTLERQVELNQREMAMNGLANLDESAMVRDGQVSLGQGEVRRDEVSLGQGEVKKDEVSLDQGEYVFDEADEVDENEENQNDEVGFEQVVETPEPGNQDKPRRRNADDFNEDDSDDENFIVHSPTNDSEDDEEEEDSTFGDHFHYYKERTILDEVSALYADPTNGLYYNGIQKEFKVIDYENASKRYYLRSLVDLDYKTLVYREVEGDYIREVHYLYEPLNVFGNIVAEKLIYKTFDEELDLEFSEVLKTIFREIDETLENTLQKLGYPMDSELMVQGLDAIYEHVKRVVEGEIDVEDTESTEDESENLEESEYVDVDGAELGEEGGEVAEIMANESDDYEMLTYEDLEALKLDPDEYKRKVKEWVTADIQELDDQMAQWEHKENSDEDTDDEEHEQPDIDDEAMMEDDRNLPNHNEEAMKHQKEDKKEHEKAEDKIEERLDLGEGDHRETDPKIRALFRRHGFGDTDTDDGPLLPADIPYNRWRRTPPPIKNPFATTYYRSLEKLEPAEVERRRRLRELIPSALLNPDF